MSAAFFQNNNNDRSVTGSHNQSISSLYRRDSQSHKLGPLDGEEYATAEVRQVQQLIENFLRLDNSQEAYLKAMQNECFGFQGTISDSEVSAVTSVGNSSQESRPVLPR